MFVAARSAKRPGSDTFILRICGTSSGMRSTSSASVSAAATTRATRSSSSAGSAGVSCAALIAAIGVGVRLLDRLDRDAAKPLQRDLHRVARQIDSLVHARGDADAADELAELDRLVVVARSRRRARRSAPAPRSRAAARGSPARPSARRSCRADRRSSSASAISGSAGGSSDLRMSSLRWLRAMLRRRGRLVKDV